MMHKVAISLAALLAGSLLSLASAHASVRINSLSAFSDELISPPLALDPPVSSSTPTDSQFSVGGSKSLLNLQTPDHSHAHQFLDPQRITFSLLPTNRTTIIYSDFAVGQKSIANLQHERDQLYWRTTVSSHNAEEWALIRRIVVGPDGWDALGEMFDVNDDERPWSTTTTIHVLAPTGDPIVPFATVAYEVDSIDVYDRFGLGGGAQISLSKSVTLGADLVYFGDRLNDTMSHETRAMARLEIQF